MLRAAHESVRGFHIARAALCGLFLVREMTVSGEHIEGTRDVVVRSILIVGLVVSLLLVAAMYRRAATQRQLYVGRFLGSTLDAVGFFAIMLCIVAWPHPGYHGLWSEPWPHAIVLIVAGSGLRLERRFVVVSGVLNIAGFATLAFLDHRWWPDQITYGVDELTFQAALLAAAMVLGLIFAARVRAVALRGARRAVEASRAREKLGAYLGTAVAREAMIADEIVMGGKRQNVAVLFSDLRGFTATAETLAPEELVVQLNAYLEEMVRVIDEQGGVVDKYIGDGIMAVFGAPATAPDDAGRALVAARRMRDALVKHNDSRAKRGLPPLEHGVGVHYGPAVAGNIGTREHAQYTIVGDVVNVASRLEGMTKEQGAAVLVSRELVDAARAVAPVDDVVSFGTLAVRGRAGAIEVFALKER